MMSESGPNAALDAPAGCAPSEGVAGSVCAAPGHGDGCAARRARESDRDCSVDCPAKAHQALVFYGVQKPRGVDISPAEELPGW